jgi:AAA domain
MSITAPIHHDVRQDGQVDGRVDVQMDARKDAGKDGRPVPSAFMVVLANHKGGVTKMTSTANIGAMFAEAGRRVLLVDCDRQANPSEAFGWGEEVPGELPSPALHSQLQGKLQGELQANGVAPPPRVAWHFPSPPTQTTRPLRVRIVCVGLSGFDGSNTGAGATRSSLVGGCSGWQGRGRQSRPTTSPSTASEAEPLEACEGRRAGDAGYWSSGRGEIRPDLRPGARWRGCACGRAERHRGIGGSYS